MSRIVSIKPKDDQNFWNFILASLSIILLAVEIWLIGIYFGWMPTGIGVFDFVLIILATFRLTRLFVYDTVAQFIRDWFLDKTEREENGEVFVVREKPKGGVKRALADLMSCPWCFGLQAAILVVFFYFLTPITWIIVLMLAVAGVATLIQLLANLIGWHAEHRKNLVKMQEEGRTKGANTC